MLCFLNNTISKTQFLHKSDSIKVEKILKGSRVSIPSLSPSVKIQIMGGKVCLRWKGKTLLGEKFVEISQQSFAILPQVTFPAHNLNFH